MRINYQTKADKVKLLKEWHDWFAWHPVKIDEIRNIVWLETIQRQMEFTNYDSELIGVKYRDIDVNVKEYINKHHNNPKGMQAMLTLGTTAKVGEIKKAVKGKFWRLI